MMEICLGAAGPPPCSTSSPPSPWNSTGAMCVLHATCGHLGSPLPWWSNLPSASIWQKNISLLFLLSSSFHIFWCYTPSFFKKIVLSSNLQRAHISTSQSPGVLALKKWLLLKVFGTTFQSVEQSTVSNWPVFHWEGWSVSMKCSAGQIGSLRCEGCWGPLRSQEHSQTLTPTHPPARPHPPPHTHRVRAGGVGQQNSEGEEFTWNSGGQGKEAEKKPERHLRTTRTQVSKSRAGWPLKGSDEQRCQARGRKNTAQKTRSGDAFIPVQLLSQWPFFCVSCCRETAHGHGEEGHRLLGWRGGLTAKTDGGAGCFPRLLTFISDSFFWPVGD